MVKYTNAHAGGAFWVLALPLAVSVLVSVGFSIPMRVCAGLRWTIVPNMHGHR